MSKVAIVSYYLNKRDTDRCFAAYNYFVQKGFDVDAYCGDFDHNSKQKVKYDLSFVTEVPVKEYEKNISLKRMKSQYKFGKDVRKILKDKSYDYIYVVGPPNSTAFLLRKLTKNTDIKLVSDIYDLYPETIPISNAKKKVLKVFGLWIWSHFRNSVIKKGDIFIGSCEYYFDYLKLDQDDTHKVIPLCKGNDVFERTDALPKEPIRILYLGALTNNYDFDSLIEVGKALRDKCQIVIVGDGPNKEWLLEELDKNEVECDFHGRVYDETKLQEIMKSCHFGFNGFKANAAIALSYKSLDYMSHSLALINCTKGDTKKLVDEKQVGINYKADQLDRLIETLKELSAEDIYKMQTNACDAFKNNYTFNCYTKKMDEIFG